MNSVEKETNPSSDLNTPRVTASETQAVKRPAVNDNSEIGEPKKKKKKKKKVGVLFKFILI